MLIDHHLPRYDVVERHMTDVAAPAERVYRTLRALDLTQSVVVRFLFRLRFLTRSPAPRSAVPQRTDRFTLDGLVAGGFSVLADEPGREIVLGVAGRFWHLGERPIRVGADGFSGFAAPGTAKAAMTFHLEALGPGRTRLMTETRVLCADAAARRSFRRYWRVVGPFSGAIRWIWLGEVRRAAERAEQDERTDREAAQR